MTTSAAHDQLSAWSPDGKKIAFHSFPIINSFHTLTSDIWVMDSDGKNQKQLTTHAPAGGDVPPAWSSDGRKIAFTSYQVIILGIWVMDSDGSNQRQLTDPVAIDIAPAWSPDGKKIAFMSNRTDTPGDWSDGPTLWVMDSDGKNQKQLTTSKEFVNATIAWSPDSKKIAFVYQAENWGIWMIDIDGKNQKQLTTHSAPDGSSVWSPDGKKIAFVSYRADTGNSDIIYGDIWVMDSDGRNQKQLTAHTAQDDFPTWSPDGKKIAFMSNRTGNGSIWVMDSDGKNQKQLTTHIGGDLGLAWSPDGKKIAFMSNRDDDIDNVDIWVLILE